MNFHDVYCSPAKTLLIMQQINPESMESLVGSELPVKFLEVDEVRHS
jgi:hypothetical protein